MPVIPLLEGAHARTGTDVTLGALTFGPDQVDSNGVEHRCRALEGWDSPELREDLADRTLAHGAHQGPNYYGPRRLELTVRLHSRHGLASLLAAEEHLLYATDLTESSALLVVHEVPAKQISVRRSGRVIVTRHSEYLRDYSISLTAADPRKYGLTERSATLSNGQSAEASNAGNFRSGAPMQVSFTGAGELEVGSAVIAATATVDVDTLEQTALVDGATAYSRLADGSEFPHLPARTSTPLYFVGTGTVTVTWRDAWV